MIMFCLNWLHKTRQIPNNNSKTSSWHNVKNESLKTIKTIYLNEKFPISIPHNSMIPGQYFAIEHRISIIYAISCYRPSNFYF